MYTTARKTILSLAAIGLAGSLSVAQANSYTIDPSHTYPSFKAPHLGISWWSGKFKKTTGTFEFDKAAKTGSVQITIDAASLDFGHEKMNQHARKADFFDVEKHPTITYAGKLNFEGDMPISVDGELTLLGNTKPLKLTIHSFKCIMHPFKKREVCGADASGEFDRNDFGMDKYGKGEAGAAKISIQVEAVKN